VAINSGCALSVIPESHRLRTEIIFDRIPWDFTRDVATVSPWCQEKSNLIVKRVANRELGPLAAFESPLAPSRSRGRIQGNLSLLSDDCDESFITNGEKETSYRNWSPKRRDFLARFGSFSSPLDATRPQEEQSCSRFFVLKEEIEMHGMWQRILQKDPVFSCRQPWASHQGGISRREFPQMYREMRCKISLLFLSFSFAFSYLF